MSKKNKSSAVEWYGLKAPSLTDAIPNIKKGDVLELSRKRRVRKTAGITHQKNGRLRCFVKTLEKGQKMTFLGEYRISNPHSPVNQLIPYVLVSVWGQEDEGFFFFTESEIRSLRIYS